MAKDCHLSWTHQRVDLHVLLHAGGLPQGSRGPFPCPNGGLLGIHPVGRFNRRQASLLYETLNAVLCCLLHLTAMCMKSAVSCKIAGHLVGAAGCACAIQQTAVQRRLCSAHARHAMTLASTVVGMAGCRRAECRCIKACSHWSVFRRKSGSSDAPAGQRAGPA